MKRRLFNLAAAVSVVLCVATLVLWVASYRLPRTRTWDSSPTTPGALNTTQKNTATLQKGVVKFGSVRTDEFPAQGLYSIGLEFDLETMSQPVWQLSGFSYRQKVLNAGAVQKTYRLMIVPFGPLAALFGSIPLVTALRMYRRRRLRPGHCPVCDYDLRATPERCPECGLGVPQPEARNARDPDEGWRRCSNQ